MTVGDATSADRARQESYRQAAVAAVAELDEIDAVVMSLEARLVTLRTRARSLTALLDVLQEVAPDAATRPEPYAPALPLDGAAGSLPRRRRVRERSADLLDLPVRVGPRPTPGPSLDPDDLLPARPAPRVDGRRASLDDDLDPLGRDLPAHR